MEYKCRCWDKTLETIFIPNMINKYGDVRHKGTATTKASENYYSNGQDFDTWLLNKTDSFVMDLFAFEDGVMLMEKQKCYENDIVEIGQGDYYKIKFSLVEAKFYFMSVKDNYKTENYSINLHFKKVGNIYENKDLLV